MYPLLILYRHVFLKSVDPLGLSWQCYGDTSDSLIHGMIPDGGWNVSRLMQCLRCFDQSIPNCVDWSIGVCQIFLSPVVYGFLTFADRHVFQMDGWNPELPRAMDFPVHEVIV